MNVLRKDHDDDENLSTADIVNPGRRGDGTSPREAYAAGLEPSHNERASDSSAPVADTRGPGGSPNPAPNTNRTVVTTERYVLKPASNDPPDYTPPQGPQAVRGGQPAAPVRQAEAIPSQIPPAAPVAAVPAASKGGNAPGPVPVPPGSTGPARPAPLFPEDELHNFRARWDQVQTSFVDEPRKAVESADSLVANVVKRIAEQFAHERETLERQWDRGDDVNTEDLRQALKRYRAFFDRLLGL